MKLANHRRPRRARPRRRDRRRRRPRPTGASAPTRWPSTTTGPRSATSPPASTVGDRRRSTRPSSRCPVPRPRQVFAIGLNYRSHAEESGHGGARRCRPRSPSSRPSLTGPFDDIEIVGDTVDWEVELVAVIGTRADRVAEADAWSHVAGLTVGQDISDRTLQFAAGAQFSLGKSRRGLRPDGAVARHARRGRRPRRPRPRLLGRRRDGAGRPHQRPRSSPCPASSPSCRPCCRCCPAT